ncbi:MAG: hypothetical protein QMC96_12865 [Methanomicrobiales archaeon]|nr:hypothetical protein [Methanomicrobiales archaeon]
MAAFEIPGADAKPSGITAGAAFDSQEIQHPETENPEQYPGKSE